MVAAGGLLCTASGETVVPALVLELRQMEAPEQATALGEAVVVLALLTEGLGATAQAVIS